MTKVLSKKMAKAYVRGHSRVVQESLRQFPPWTYAEVVFVDPHSTEPKTGQPLSYRASAAVSLYYLDEWDPELGIRIAVGKARATIAKKFRAWKKHQRRKAQTPERHVVTLAVQHEDETMVTIVGV